MVQVEYLRGFPKVVLEGDCSVAIELIKACLKGAPAEPIVKGIVNVASRFEDFKLQFVKREGNAIIEWLARNCDVADIDICILDIPCIYISNL